MIKVVIKRKESKRVLSESNYLVISMPVSILYLTSLHGPDLHSAL